MSGRDVFDAAIPAPVAGCMTKNGATSVTKLMIRAGARVGRRTHSNPKYCYQCRGEQNADGVVRAPADDALVPHRRSLPDTLVYELATREVADPAAKQRVVERRHAVAPEKRRPTGP